MKIRIAASGKSVKGDKYVLTDETVKVKGKTLYRIKALKAFGKVKIGQLGGYIESEENLSQDGNAWIMDRARVYDKAEVSGDALVLSNVEVFGNAKVYGKAQVFGDTKVYGKAQVFGDTKVYDNAEIYGNARVSGKTIVSGSEKIYR